MRPLLLTAALMAALMPLATAQQAPEVIATLNSFELVDVALPDDKPTYFSTLLKLSDRNFVLELEQRSIWSPDAVVVVIGEQGPERRPVPAVNTYRGTVAGAPGSSVTATLQRDGLHAQIQVPGLPTYTVEPLDQSQNGLHIAFTKDDSVPLSGYCEEPARSDLTPPGSVVPVPSPLDDGLRISMGIGTSAFVAELGIDVDSDYISVTGGIDDALDEVATFLNTVNGAYEQDLGITHVVTVVVLHLFPAFDPYTAIDGTIFNSQQADYWRNEPTLQAIGWDLVLTMTGKDTCTSGPSGCNLLGRANGLGVVCNRNSAFCYAEYMTNDTDQAMLVAHEMGHLWSGTHCAAGASGCANTSPCLTMCNTIGGCNNAGGVAFGPCNVNQIIAHRDSRSCLDAGTTSVSYVDWRPCGVFCSEAGDLAAPYNTLREAADDAVPGGTVIITSGTSSESAGDETFPLRINKALTLRKLGSSGARAGT